MALRRMTRSKWFAVAVVLALSTAVIVGMLPLQAGAIVPPDQPGSYHVGYYTTTYYVFPFGFYAAKIRYPATYDGWLAPKNTSGKPYPGIVVTDGYLSGYCDMDWLAQHLTTRGYVTLTFTTPFPASIDTTQWAYGFSGGIDFLRSENGSWLSPMRGLLDTGKFGIIGLSMGGAGALEAAGTDPEVDAAVSLAPGATSIPFTDFVWADAKNGARNIRVPAQIQLGSRDCIVSEAAYGYYPLIPSTTIKEFVGITGANHVDYLDEGSIGEALGTLVDCTATISTERQHQISRKYFTAWFERYLRGKTEFETYLFGTEAQNDLSSGVLYRLEYNRP